MAAALQGALRVAPAAPARLRAPAAPAAAAACAARVSLAAGRSVRLSAGAAPRAARRGLVVRAGEGDEAEAGEGEAERPARGARGAAGGKREGGRGGPGGPRGRAPKEKPEFEERVVQVSRVTKVVKGGKQLSFRAVVVIGNKGGKVGVGVAKAKEVIIAVQKAVTDAKKNLALVPITAVSSVPHKLTVKGCGSSQVMIRPAPEGSGITAGGAVRAVLELAGYKNVNAKMMIGTNPLNNGRAALAALKHMRTPEQVAASRGLTTEEVRPRRAAPPPPPPPPPPGRAAAPHIGARRARARAQLQKARRNPLPRARRCARCAPALTRAPRPRAPQITARLASARMAPSGL
jgi:small subunit ribosomal protein S5